MGFYIEINACSFKESEGVPKHEMVATERLGGLTIGFATKEEMWEFHHRLETVWLRVNEVEESGDNRTVLELAHDTAVESLRQANEEIATLRAELADSREQVRLREKKIQSVYNDWQTAAQHWDLDKKRLKLDIEELKATGRTHQTHQTYRVEAHTESGYEDLTAEDLVIRKNAGRKSIMFYLEEIERLKKEVAQHDKLADLRWKAEMAAIGHWRAEDPERRTLTMPDHTDLCVWLLDKLETTENRLAEMTRQRNSNHEQWKLMNDRCDKLMVERNELEDALAKHFKRD